MVEFDEHGIATDENGHQEFHPFHEEHRDNRLWEPLRQKWAQAHPEEMGNLGGKPLDKGE